MTVFRLPDLGEGLPDAEIVAWHVAAGDHVVADQPLVSVETAKAVVEVPSPQAGHIARLCAEPGLRVKVGDPLVEFEEGRHADTGAVVGELGAAAAPAPAPAPRFPPSPVARVQAAPAVRALAREIGVELAGVRGTGPGGSITRADVEAARAASKAVPAGAEPLAGVRRAMAQAMVRARAAVVPATVTDEADVEAWAPGTDVTVRLVRSVVQACQAAPDLNAWFDEATLSRRLHQKVDLGIAVDTAGGLFVPVLRDAGAHSEAELRRLLGELKRSVESRSIALADLRDPTITLSNFGTLGGRHAALTVLPPQVAILGAGRIAPHPVAAGGGVAIHRVLPLSLTFDHRAVTGGEAARFLAAAVADLELAG